jgi:UPF0271 protein
MEITPQEAFDLVLYQVGALAAFTRAARVELRHVKPHGALYNMAARDANLARAVADAVWQFNPQLVLVGLSGSELIQAGLNRGLPVASEVFADRGYEPDGSLTPRGRPGAMIDDVEQAAQRVIEMVRNGRVLSTQGTPVAIRADTVCIHGDRPHAAEFARTIRQRLEQAGISVRTHQNFAMMTGKK